MRTLLINWASLVAQLVKNLPAVQETRVWSLGWEDPLEKEMATHSSILAWKISWTEKPGGLQSMGSQRVGHDWATNTNALFINYLINLKSIHTGSTVEFLILNVTVSDEWIWCPDKLKKKKNQGLLHFDAIIKLQLSMHCSHSSWYLDCPATEEPLEVGCSFDMTLVVLDSITAIRYPKYILFSFFSVPGISGDFL